MRSCPRRRSAPFAKGAGAGSHLVGIGRPAVVEVLADNPWLNACWTFQPGRQNDQPGRRDLPGRLRAGGFDTAILFPNSFESAAIAWLAGIPHRLGYARDGRSPLLTRRLPPPRSGWRLRPIPAIDYYLTLPAALGFATADRRMALYLNDQDKRLYQQFAGQARLASDRRTVVIHHGCASGHGKCWPALEVLALCRLLLTQADLQVVLHCGPAERQAVNAVAAELNDPRVASLGQADTLCPGLSKALMAQADLVISTDSGPRHIAAALDRPLISLFGPTDPAWSRTYNQPEVVLDTSLACRRCARPCCLLGHRACMTRLSAERVYRAAIVQLDEPPRVISRADFLLQPQPDGAAAG
jgi:heptosyltransferase-2